MEQKIDRMKSGRLQTGYLANETIGHHLKRPVVITATLLIRMGVAPNIGHKQTRQGFVTVKKRVSNNLEIVIPDEFMGESVEVDECAANSDEEARSRVVWAAARLFLLDRTTCWL